MRLMIKTVFTKLVGKTILIIDDSKADALLIRSRLSCLEGVRFVILDSVDKALVHLDMVKVGHPEPHLIIIDNHLHGDGCLKTLNGYELGLMFKRATTDTKIVGHSGSIGCEDLFKAFKADRYFDKDDACKGLLAYAEEVLA